MPNIDLREVTAESLSEAAVTDNGRVRMRIIGPGWSANGRFYPPETLQAAAADRVFSAGTHSYIDHPSRSEEADRPERSLRDLAGTLATDAVWESDGPAGPGLYADATVRDEYRPLVDDLADVIGPSIRAEGVGRAGEVDGRSGTIIDEITAAESVDYVTRPAAGGRVLQLMESVRDGDTPELREARNAADWIEVEIHRGVLGLINHMWEQGHLTRDEWQAVNTATVSAMSAFRDDLTAAVPDLLSRDPLATTDPAPTPVTESTTTEGGRSMTEQEERELRESLATAQRERDDARRDLEEASGGGGEPLSRTRRQIQGEMTNMRRELAETRGRERARQVLSAHLAEGWVPPATAHRITETLLASLPLTDQLELDESQLVERADTELERAEVEIAEALSAAGVGRPRDFGYGGDGGAPVNAEQAEQEAEALFQRLGMSESAAKVAARGRS